MKPLSPRTLPLLLLAIPLLSSAQTLKKTIIIPQTSFQNQSIFSTHWDPNYPWGTDHNGAARMVASQIKLDPTNGNGTLTLTAKRVPAGSQKPASHGGKQINIRYLSGTVSAKQHFTVGSVPGSGFDFGGEFRAPVGRGTWPAFWVTGVKGVCLIFFCLFTFFGSLAYDSAVFLCPVPLLVDIICRSLFPC
ncbi:hypothetical protein V8F06_004743 [Rhypophila decipiens]